MGVEIVNTRWVSSKLSPSISISLSKIIWTLHKSILNFLNYLTFLLHLSFYRLPFEIWIIRSLLADKYMATLFKNGKRGEVCTCSIDVLATLLWAIVLKILVKFKEQVFKIWMRRNRIWNSCEKYSLFLIRLVFCENF